MTFADSCSGDAIDRACSGRDSDFVASTNATSHWNRSFCKTGLTCAAKASAKATTTPCRVSEMPQAGKRNRFSSVDVMLSFAEYGHRFDGTKPDQRRHQAQSRLLVPSLQLSDRH